MHDYKINISHDINFLPTKKMSYIIIKYLVLALVLLANLFQVFALEKRKCFILYKAEVHIINNLPSNSTPLVVHCASKNDDLGRHILTINQEFHFDFCVNPFATLFFCHLWWGNHNKAFDAFDVTWKSNPCLDASCYWTTKNDGIHLSGFSPLREVGKINWE